MPLTSLMASSHAPGPPRLSPSPPPLFFASPVHTVFALLIADNTSTHSSPPNLIGLPSFFLMHDCRCIALLLHYHSPSTPPAVTHLAASTDARLRTLTHSPSRPRRCTDLCQSCSDRPRFWCSCISMIADTRFIIIHAWRRRFPLCWPVCCRRGPLRRRISSSHAAPTITTTPHQFVSISMCVRS